jgi:hypothetical protein
MPAVSSKQQQFMAICAHSPGAARGKCPSHAVAEEFSHKPAGGYFASSERAQAKRNRKHWNK